MPTQLSDKTAHSLSKAATPHSRALLQTNRYATSLINTHLPQDIAIARSALYQLGIFIKFNISQRMLPRVGEEYGFHVVKRI